MWGLKRRGGQGFPLHGSAESLVIAVMIVLVVLAVLVLPVLLAVARAAPPAGVKLDPEISAWYRSLRDVNGISCCDESDCRPVTYRAGPEGLEVFIDRASYGPAAPDAWVPVPPQAVLARENPTGGAVACYYAGRVACFVYGGQG